MARSTHNRTIVVYETENGAQPIEDWLTSLKDKKAEFRIRQRIDRINLGNFGDNKSVGDGVNELRLFFGPGYRVYFAEDSEIIVVLLCGGDKNSQTRDIKRAKEYWQDYQRRKDEL